MFEPERASGVGRSDGVVVRYRPPQISPSEAELARALGLTRNTLRCSLAGEAVEVCPVPPSRIPDQNERWIAVANAADDIRLLLPERAFFHYVERLLPGEDIAGVAQVVTLSAFEHSIEPLLLELERATSRPAHLATIEEIEAGALRAHHCALGAVITGASFGPVPIMIELPESDTAAAIALLAQFFPPLANQRPLPLRASLRFGYTLIALDDLVSLRSGDAVLLDTHMLNERKAALVVEEHLVAPCVIDGELRLLAEPLMPAAETRLSGWCGRVEQRSHADALASASGATVRLDFDGWSGFLDVQTLAALTVGGQVPGVREINTRVLIRFNGHVVGGGEIVQVSERFAARIDHLRVGR